MLYLNWTELSWTNDLFNCGRYIIAFQPFFANNLPRMNRLHWWQKCHQQACLTVDVLVQDFRDKYIDIGILSTGRGSAWEHLPRSFFPPATSCSQLLRAQYQLSYRPIHYCIRWSVQLSVAMRLCVKPAGRDAAALLISGHCRRHKVSRSADRPVPLGGPAHRPRCPSTVVYYAVHYWPYRIGWPPSVYAPLTLHYTFTSCRVAAEKYFIPDAHPLEIGVKQLSWRSMRRSQNRSNATQTNKQIISFLASLCYHIGYKKWWTGIMHAEQTSMCVFSCWLLLRNNRTLDYLCFGESMALLVARRTNNQPTIGRLRVRGLLK